MAEDNTPDTSLGPLVNLLAPLGVLATRSDDVKHIAESFRVAWALPWVALALLVAGFCSGLAWLYRRALARRKPWALWLRGLMPWNRAA